MQPNMITAEYKDGQQTVDPWTYAQLLGGFSNNNVIVFGDSIGLNYGGYNLPATQSKSDKSPLLWADAKAGGVLEIVYNAGVSGNTTTQIFARLERDITPYASLARRVIYQGGINDPANGVTLEQTKANQVKILSRLRQLFPEVVALSPTPYAPNAATSAQVALIAAFARDYYPTLPGVRFIDAYNYVVNPTSSTGDLKAGFSNDAPQLHLNATGARYLGEQIYADHSDLFRGLSSISPVSDADTFATFGANCTQLLSNPLMIRSAGTVGANTVGTVGTDWTVRDTAGASSNTASLVARADGFGNDQRVVIAAGASAVPLVLEGLTNSFHTAVSSGDVVQACITMSFTGMANCTRLVPYLQFTDAGGAQQIYLMNNDNNSTFNNADFANYTFKSFPYRIRGSCTDLRLRWTLYGTTNNVSGTMQFGRCGIRRRNPSLLNNFAV